MCNDHLLQGLGLLPQGFATPLSGEPGTGRGPAYGKQIGEELGDRLFIELFTQAQMRWKLLFQAQNIPVEQGIPDFTAGSCECLAP